MSDGQTPAHQASDPAVSAWVSANAGSGKTYVLTARVIRLLLEDIAPDRLLCLTYTRAAAAEMRARVFETLGRWALMDDAALADDIRRIDGAAPDAARMSRARRLFARALETPGGLKIQTIHAFCERLVGRFPIEANVPVPFEVLMEGDTARMKADARRRALAEMDEAEAGALMETLAPFMGAAGFAELFEGRSAQMIAAYGDADPWAVAGLAHGVRPADLLAEAGYDEPARKASFAAGARALASGKRDKPIAEALARAVAAHDVEARFEALQEAFLTQEGKPRAAIGVKAQREADPVLFDALDDERDRLAALMARMGQAASAEMTHAIATLGKAVARLYEAEKRARGKLDFDDLIRAALHLLRDSEAAAWALYKLDGGLDHILIDEAQDTSPEQWAVVERIAEEFFAGGGRPRRDPRPRTLFAVGDEKQSIFSFQGADPAAFARFRTLFGARITGAGETFLTPTLNESRRSTPAVLALTDAVFRDDEALRKSVVGEGAWARHLAHRTDAPGCVEIWPMAQAEKADEADSWLDPVDAPTKSDPVTHLADVLADEIGAWIGREGVADKAGGVRALQAGDVLILVRSRGRLSQTIIRKLKQKGVPVAGADRLDLLSHIAVQDLIAFGRAALLPQDDLNLAALLRSPFFDLSEDEVFALAHDRPGHLWGRLREAAAGEGGIAVDRARARRAYEALRDAMNRLGRDAPFDFYTRLMTAGGGRAAMLARFGEEAEDVIDEFLSAAAAHEETNAPSLEGFLHALETQGGMVKRDPDAAGGAVRVLTAHGAKGLEAPVVILPDTMSLPPASYIPNLLEWGGALVWKPFGSAEAEAAKTAWQEAEHAEHKRLLYVALTRPRDRLIVCGVKPGREPGKAFTTWYQAIAAGFGRLEATLIETPLGPGLRHGAPTLATAAPVVAAAAPPIPAWARETAAQEEAIDVVRPSRLGPSLALGDAAAQFGFERGRVLHRLLQSLPDVAPAHRRAAGERFLAARAANWPAGEREAALERILGILDEPGFAAAFAPGSRAEVPIAGRVRALGPKGFISGQIDRLAVTAADVLIVDYKTNRAVPASPAAAPRPYLRQMALYREAMRAAFPGRAVRAALLWTEGPSLMELPDSALDEALGALAQS